VIPGRDAIAIVVTMLLEDEMLHSRHIREYLDEVERSPAVREVTEGLTPTRFFTEVVPVGGFDARPRFHADRVLVVSDLVGVTNPLNRDGFSSNLGMCLAAAGTIRDAVRQGDFSVATLAAYSRQLEQAFAEHITAERRRERSRRGQPAWQWASKPELVSSVQGMTAREKSGTLPAGDVWGRLRGLGRRAGVHRHAPGEYDE
jgi:flavin-dependent dehydrogenase